VSSLSPIGSRQARGEVWRRDLAQGHVGFPDLEWAVLPRAANTFRVELGERAEPQAEVFERGPNGVEVVDAHGRPTENEQTGRVGDRLATEQTTTPSPAVCWTVHEWALSQHFRSNSS